MSALPDPEPARAALENVFAGGHGRIVAALLRRFGPARLALVENAVQEASLRALERWPEAGIPKEPERWILQVAHHGLVDVIRRDERSVPLGDEHEGSLDPPSPEVDDELCLVFLSCHPVLPRAAQIALTLRVAYGFSSAQIARAFLSDERTIAQRIVRAKQRLREEGARFELPEPAELPSRLEPILDVLYQLFAEGYAPAEADEATVLCEESLRLLRALTRAERTATPAAEALCALCCFQLARNEARRADDGSLLLLHEQDRARWDRALLDEGFERLGRAARGTSISRFHAEAGIAACHASAPSFAGTEWGEIVFLYDALRACAPSPVVDVNRAFALAMRDGAVAGLDALDAIPERDLMARYPYAQAAYAELHASLGHLAEARAYLTRALEHQTSPAERALLRRKLSALARG